VLAQQTKTSTVTMLVVAAGPPLAASTGPAELVRNWADFHFGAGAAAGSQH